VSVFEIENLEASLKSLKLYSAGQADFSDYLIQQIARKNGYETVISFDKKALKNPGFQKPS
jgi:predicted nucleic-acid-binding protein